MIEVREYIEEQDAEIVGRLIAETYATYNLDFASPEALGSLLGPFQNAGSDEPEHQRAIAEAIRASMVWVAENERSEIVGVLRGRVGRLHSLFVRGDHHRMGVGKALMACYENACRLHGCKKITMASTLYAVPFYQRLGYKKSTGVRKGWSFEGEGLQWQPMKKVLSSD